MIDLNLISKQLITLNPWARGLLCLVLGAILSLGLPPIGLWPVIYPCFGGLLLLLCTTPNPRATALSCYLFAFGYLTAAHYWVGNALIVFSDQLAFLAIPASLGLSAVLALYYAVAGGVIGYGFKRFGGDKKIIGGLLVILCFSIADLARQYGFTGFAFNLFGMLFADNLYLSQQAALWGIEGMGVMVLLTAVMPFMITSPSNLKRIAAGLLIPVLVYGYGTWRVSTLDLAASPDESAPQIRLVQGSIPQREKWDRQFISRNLNLYQTLSMQQGWENISAIIWPETTVPSALNQSPELVARLSQFIPEDGLLITGAIRHELIGSTDQRIYNSLYLLNSRQGIIGRYDKSHLVPFGEYLPLRPILSLFGLDKLTHGRIDYSAGTGPVTLNARQNHDFPAFSALICYEISFSRNIIAPSADHQSIRPQLIINLTNDAWFGDTLGPRHHLAHSRLRAIEQGIPVIRSASTGISAVIDGLGRIAGQLPIKIVGVLDRPLPPSLSPTFYALYGKIGFFIMIGLLVFLLGILNAHRSKKIP